MFNARYFFLESGNYETKNYQCPKPIFQSQIKMNTRFSIRSLPEINLHGIFNSSELRCGHFFGPSNKLNVRSLNSHRCMSSSILFQEKRKTVSCLILATPLTNPIRGRCLSENRRKRKLVPVNSELGKPENVKNEHW